MKILLLFVMVSMLVTSCGSNHTNVTPAEQEPQKEIQNNPTGQDLGTSRDMSQGCYADLNEDGSVDLNDLNLVLANFGLDTSTLSADVDGDGLIDQRDIKFVQAYWGLCIRVSRDDLPAVNCRADFDKDLNVDMRDLSELLAAFGTHSVKHDLSQNGDVDGRDIEILKAHWGACDY